MNPDSVNPYGHIPFAVREEAFFSYPNHYACFCCRKMFNKPAYRNISAKIRSLYPTMLAFQEYQPPCPQCRTPMTNMGNGFKPPRHNDLRRWRTMEKAARAGQRFWYYPSWL